jgi:hypothetical protein
VVRESQRKRYADPAAVDKVIALDKEWRDGERVAWLLIDYGGSGGCHACISSHCMQTLFRRFTHACSRVQCWNSEDAVQRAQQRDRQASKGDSGYPPELLRCKLLHTFIA